MGKKENAVSFDKATFELGEIIKIHSTQLLFNNDLMKKNENFLRKRGMTLKHILKTEVKESEMIYYEVVRIVKLKDMPRDY